MQATDTSNEVQIIESEKSKLQQLQEEISKEKTDRANAFNAELGILLKKYNCNLSGIVQISGNEISSNVAVIALDHQ